MGQCSPKKVNLNLPFLKSFEVLQLFNENMVEVVCELLGIDFKIL